MTDPRKKLDESSDQKRRAEIIKALTLLRENPNFFSTLDLERFFPDNESAFNFRFHVTNKQSSFDPLADFLKQRKDLALYLLGISKQLSVSGITPSQQSEEITAELIRISRIIQRALSALVQEQDDPLGRTEVTIAEKKFQTAHRIAKMIQFIQEQKGTPFVESPYMLLNALIAYYAIQ